MSLTLHIHACACAPAGTADIRTMTTAETQDAYLVTDASGRLPARPVTVTETDDACCPWCHEALQQVSVTAPRTGAPDTDERQLTLSL